ncbi:MAG: hypothetical protein QXK88_05665 [Desulfurococcaceae archaeon]
MKTSTRDDSLDHSYQQSRRGPQRVAQPSRVEDRRVTPQPIGDRCNPLCLLFICSRNAFFLANRPFKGRIVKVAQCRLTGSDCIGGECQYSSCKVNSLLPNNKCSKALEKKISRTSDDDIFKEMMKFEEYDVTDFKR